MVVHPSLQYTELMPPMDDFSNSLLGCHSGPNGIRVVRAGTPRHTCHHHASVLPRPLPGLVDVEKSSVVR